MNELVKFEFLISFLDSFRFGAFTEAFTEYYLDNMLVHAEDTILECILVLKFKGITDNAKDLENYVLIAKEYYEKAKYHFKNNDPQYQLSLENHNKNGEIYGNK